MSPHVQIGLALILCLPTFAILIALYCIYPRTTASKGRLVADIVVCSMALVSSVTAMRYGFLTAMGVGGPLWKQLLATLLAYGTFLAVLGAGCGVRARMLLRATLSARAFAPTSI